MSSPNFDRIAPVYDFLATLIFGQEIRKAQTLFLHKIPDHAHVLILGGGTGWILEAMTGRPLSIDYVDASKKMLTRARKRPVIFKSLHFIHGNEDRLTNRSYDVVITPFVLDVCNDNQLPIMVNKISQLIQSDGYWLCIDFNAKDTSLKSKCLDVSMRYFFRLVSNLKLQHLLPYFDTIQQAGFQERSTSFFYGQFIQASWFQKIGN